MTSVEDVTWFPGYGPVPLLGDCPHYTCFHNQTVTLGWGPDQIRCQVWRCDVPEGGCDGTCRAMVNVAGYGVWKFTGQSHGHFR
jgi:hypothetical protein